MYIEICRKLGNNYRTGLGLVFRVSDTQRHNGAVFNAEQLY